MHKNLMKSYQSMSVFTALFRIICVLFIIGISACTLPSSEQKEVKTQGKINPHVDSDNIFNLLVANIAYHQNEDELALQSLATVAKNSQNASILEDAISLAYRLEKPELLNELNTILLEVDPNNDYALINKAHYSFKNNQQEKGIKEIITYLKNIEETKPNSIRNASSLILAQNRDTQDSILYELTHTENINTYLTAAIIYGLNQRDDLHIKWLDETLELQPGLEYPALLKLDYYLKNKPTQRKSLSKFTRHHLKKNPSHTRFRMLYASYLIDNKEYQAAIKQLREVVDYEPDNDSAFYIMGLTYLQEEKYKEAVIAFEQANQLAPENEQTLFYLADAHQGLQQPNDAIKALQKISTDENYFDAQLRIGMIMADSQSLTKAINYLKNIDTHNEEEKLRIIYAQDTLYQTNEKWQSALTLLNDALKQFPNNTDLLYKRGYIYAVQGNIAQHEADMRNILKQEPNNSDAYNALGYTLADQTTRYNEALELIQKAYALSPESPYILDSLGWVYYRLGNYEKALTYLSKAYELYKDPEIATHLGEVYWQMGDKKLARDFWQQAQALDPDNDSLKETRARLENNDTGT